MSLGDRIRAALEAAGLSQEELANRAGVAPRTIRNWESGARAPRSKLGALEHVLGVRLRDEPANHHVSVSIEDASDAQAIANLAHRLAERDRKIRELAEEVDELTDQLERLRTAEVSPELPARWAARTRDTDNGGGTKR